MSLVNMFGNKIPAAGGGNGLLTGLESYYELESDGTDSHGANNLSAGGTPVHAAVKLGNGLDSNGGGNSYSSGAVFDDTAWVGFSLSFWFSLETDAPTEALFNMGVSDGTPLINWSNNSANQVNPYLGGSFRSALGYSITVGVLYHLALRWDGTNWHSNLNNGTKKTITLGLSTSTTNTIRLCSGFFNQIDAKIDEVGIWNIDIGDSGVSSLYNSGSGLAYSSFT